ncbi:MAG: translation initiation factor IF-2 subunit beta [Promethearchaeota archaeon Loki_b31]|nr:MAG: translation initiation factor IF-2 subunit beta [Candidatus Lokiarchaeota archaeon Loki_b31]
MDINNYHELLDKGYENIPDNVKKLSRFEIPKVQIRIEAKNTYITNFNKIINTLNRDRKHFIVEFLKKVGTMGEMRGKHLFLKGVYKEQVLNRLIELYSKTYVLCKICNKPDTEIQREGKKKFLKCTACGAHEEIKEK